MFFKYSLINPITIRYPFANFFFNDCRVSFNSGSLKKTNTASAIRNGLSR